MPEENSIPTPFLLIPIELGIEVFHSRKFKAFSLLFHLKMEFQAGLGTCDLGKMKEIALKSGIKSNQTIRKHLKWLSKMGYITYHEDTGYIRHYSLFKRHKTYKTGVRFFKSADLRQTLFAGLSLWLIHRTDYIQRKSGINGRAKNASFVTDGVSLQYLAKILEYSPIRISQLKKNPHIHIKHRFKKKKVSPEYFRIIREFDPAQGKKMKLNRKCEMYQTQMVDKFEFHGVELTRRRYVA